MNSEIESNSPILSEYSPNDILLQIELKVNILDKKYRQQNSNQPCDEWRAFISASNGLKVRFRAMVDADHIYTETVQTGNSTPENLYQQDNALFTFFTNAVSVLEIACFLVFALASQLQPATFPMNTKEALRKINPKVVVKNFKLVYPKEYLTQTLETLIADQQFQELKETRNILSHQGNPPRNYYTELNIIPGAPLQHKYIGGPKGEPPKWNGIVLDKNAIALRRQWVAKHIKAILEATLKFADNKIKP